jgi:hypothetical protein
MPSTADNCWRLSADCSHWAEESRDNAARLAFRQMATAWAGLAFSQDFVSATHEPVDLTSSESSQAAQAENIASSKAENEEIVPVSNTEVNAERSEQTTRASTSEQRERLSLPTPTRFPKR